MRYDGPTHDDAARLRYDERRAAWLARRGVRVPRLGMRDVMKFATAVPEAVKQDGQIGRRSYLVAQGYETQFGSGPGAAFELRVVQSAACMAEAPIDDSFMKEALASPKGNYHVNTAGGYPV
jgi:hypothetical protein